jgi:hypothetical protein
MSPQALPLDQCVDRAQRRRLAAPIRQHGKAPAAFVLINGRQVGCDSHFAGNPPAEFMREFSVADEAVRPRGLARRWRRTVLLPIHRDRIPRHYGSPPACREGDDADPL